MSGLDRLFNAHELKSHIFFLFQAEHELRVAQTEFDRQAEVTRLLLEGISSTHVWQPHFLNHSLLSGVNKIQKALKKLLLFIIIHLFNSRFYLSWNIALCCVKVS